MKTFSLFKLWPVVLCFLSACAKATGMVPESSIVIVDQADGEGAINIKNTDAFPVLLLTTIVDTADDKESLLTVSPPAARVEPGRNQRVRFIFTSKIALKTERLKRVIFEGVPPQQKGGNEVRMTVRQNIPVIIRPAGLEKDFEPWKRLKWRLSSGSLIVSNPSPYVVRLGPAVKTLPDNTQWTLPNSYILPGQELTVSPDGGNRKDGLPQQVRISPATTWGYTVNNYDAEIGR
ncbi:fimbria/pilus chaperone family protein [Type-D symbiont of Plautia stali]|uniref:fimbria/pilus chaperone family protein n=1 Tax=Type-D symbiont of Plautia stali TaxID=1560356 RepID=UPI00073F7D2B|nr:fimbria/pilus chaperone family protein [Type-D symbiont of Plautia stali]